MVAIGVIAGVPIISIIDLVAEATWVACCMDTAAQAHAFEVAANAWVRDNPFQLYECAFEEHVPGTAFFLSFEAGEFDRGWACYCHCGWVLHRRFPSIEAAMEEARKYFDQEGLSSLYLEYLVFGDEDCEVLPDGRPCYVYDPELRIFVAKDHHVEEYLLSGEHKAVMIELIDSRPFQPATSP